jgi:2-polyprenyl-3-methyl-5-hydroxy-6-metoxy-1,4-benzoquinol methylase
VNSTGRRLEGEFYQYMHGLREVDAAANRSVFKFYVPYFAKCKQVLDVGCGEGQFIEELTAQGIRASGVDADPVMVEECRKKGLSVAEANLFDYLPQHAGEFDGVLCSNLIEHLAMPDVLRLLELARAALQPGGLLLIATPNAESLIVHLYEFWRDATHVRLYNRPLLEFLLSWVGLQSIQSGENPATAWTPPADLQSIPSVLKHLSPVQELAPEKGNAQAAPDSSMRPSWRHAISSLRRRAGRFLARTIFLEEFDLLNARVADLEVSQAAWRTAAQQVGSALYNSQTRSLLAPREIFALGVNPVPEHEDGR